MDQLINNPVSDILLKNHYTLVGSCVLLALIIFIAVFYDVIYSGSSQSYFDKIGKAFLIGGGLSLAITYLFDSKHNSSEKVYKYEDLSNSDN